MATDQRKDLLPGTLDMMILKTLTLGAQHGYGLAKHIERVSSELLRVDEGSLYPALQRMRQKGWISAEWGKTPNNQRARYYTITTLGRRQLGEQTKIFAQLVAAIGQVMRAT